MRADTVTRHRSTWKRARVAVRSRSRLRADARVRCLKTQKELFFISPLLFKLLCCHRSQCIAHSIVTRIILRNIKKTLAIKWFDPTRCAVFFPPPPFPLYIIVQFVSIFFVKSTKANRENPPVRPLFKHVKPYTRITSITSPIHPRTSVEDDAEVSKLLHDPGFRIFYSLWPPVPPTRYNDPYFHRRYLRLYGMLVEN